MENKPKEITRAELDELYSKPINPDKPFERLNLLMEWTMQELNKHMPPPPVCGLPYEGFLILISNINYN